MIEEFVHSYGLGYGYPICGLRPTGVYGVAHPIFHHPGDGRRKLIGRAEQVIVDEELLQQVLRLDELGPGTFLAKGQRRNDLGLPQ